MKRAFSNNTILGTSFSLNRLYYEPCPRGEFEEGMGVFSCGWLIPDYPIACSSGSIVGETKGNWHTCDRYPEAVLGKEMMPIERKN
jgi:hypothetical protein